MSGPVLRLFNTPSQRS